MYRRRGPADFALTDQSGTPWTLSDHLDAAALLAMGGDRWASVDPLRILEPS